MPPALRRRSRFGEDAKIYVESDAVSDTTWTVVLSSASTIIYKETAFAICAIVTS